jgi:hypothetical protein
MAAALVPSLLPAAAGATLGTTKNVIEGHVRDGSGGGSGDPGGIVGICVTANIVGTSTAWSTQTVTGGFYKLLVPDGTFKVKFTDCRPTPVYLTQWWDNARTAANATPITLGGALTPVQVEIDAAMKAGAVLTGVVSGTDTGAPIAGICVSAYRAGQPEQRATTDSNGRYAMTLTNGTWGIHVEDCRPERVYLATGGSVYIDGYTTTTATLDLQMALGGTISGRVTDDATGAPIAGICAYSDEASMAPTGADGTYRVGGLDTGTHLLWFQECDHTSGPGHDYANEYFHHAPSSRSATSVSVNAPGNTVVDETLVHAGTVTGTVTDASTGLPVSNVRVNLWFADGSIGPYTDTGPDGTYSLTLVLPGDGYTMQFSDYLNGRYDEQWWNDKPPGGTPDTFSIASGGTTSGIDAAMQPR